MHQQQNHTVLPEHIRASLAKYSEHANLTCLECGYVGLMGIRAKERKTPPAKMIAYGLVFLGLLALVLLYTTVKGINIPWWLCLIAGAILGGFITGVINHYECPNCNADLTQK